MQCFCWTNDSPVIHMILLRCMGACGDSATTIANHIVNLETLYFMSDRKQTLLFEASLLAWPQIYMSSESYSHQVSPSKMLNFMDRPNLVR